jgi:hypothetical protein
MVPKTEFVQFHLAARAASNMMEFKSLMRRAQQCDATRPA